MAIAVAIAASAAGGSQSATLLANPVPPGGLAGRPVSVHVDATPTAVAAVSPDFLGLSFEASDLQTIAGYATNGNLIRLMRSVGPGVMRFGGFSADHTTAWIDDAPAPIGATGPVGPAGNNIPAWASSTITPADLAGIAGIADATGWRVLLTVNLGHYDPAAAADEAQSAEQALGSNLVGIAIGNEPDHFVNDGLRPSGWSVQSYLAELSAYESAISAAAPGVPIVGPDVSSGEPPAPWIATGSDAIRPTLLTDHYYPLTACGTTPKLVELLSIGVRTEDALELRKLTTLARNDALPLRLDETNNISCSGQPGVSNTFAAALWAVDFIAKAMHSGISGINFHDLITEPTAYSPLVARNAGTLATGQLAANPEWYALLLSRYLLRDHPVSATDPAAAAGLTVSAFLSPSGELHIVLDDFDPAGSGRLVVHLHVPNRFASGTIMRLTARSTAAIRGVRLGGRAVSANGAWNPRARLPHVFGGPGALVLTIRPASAALVTLYPQS